MRVAAVLPFTPLASALGFTLLPLALLAGAVKARFYAHEARLREGPMPERDRRHRHHRHVHRRAARFRGTRGPRLVT